MTEREILISHCVDKINSASENMMITSTDFLSCEEKSEIINLHKRYSRDADIYFYGGYGEAERTVALFVPKCFGFQGDSSDLLNEYPDSNPVAVIRLTKDKFSSASHRDYLGALMGLGIKRKLIGDILVFDWGAYIFVFDSIKDFICDNLDQCGRASVRCEAVTPSAMELPDERTDTVFHSVASMRLDNILSAGFGLSRTVCTQAIASGIVFVNSVKAEKNDFQIHENDKIVLRGKGKIVVENIIGRNKKDRIHINIRHYK